MKKQNMVHGILAGVMMISTVAARADESQDPNVSMTSQAPGATISVKSNIGKSTWLTVYNVFGSIRDSGCLNPGQTVNFGGYYGPIAFKVRGEVTEGANCGGKVIADIDKGVVVSINLGADLSVEEGVTHNYYLQTIRGAEQDDGRPQPTGGESAQPNSSATITTNNHVDKSVWVTVYNFFGSIRDSGCLNLGQTKDFTNYWGPLAFKVRGEVTAGPNCSGNVVADVFRWVSVDPLSGVTVSMEKNAQGGAYFWNRN